MARLIDESKAYEVLTDYYHHTTDTQHAALREALSRVPTVDAVPVRHGRWTDDNACQFCGFQPWYEHDIHTLSYCPNCGAKMDGKDGDHHDNNH